MSVTIAVCEDRPDDSAAICNCIKQFCDANCYTADIHVFESGEEFLSAFKPGMFQIIFMDIFLPGISGLKTARKIRETDPNVSMVMATTSRDHARQGYAVQAVAYVEKPVEQRKIDCALSVCLHLFEKSSRVIYIPAGRGRNTGVPLANVEFVEVYNKITLFRMNGYTIRAHLPLDEVDRMLGGEPFLRCHRSYIVNMRYVADVLERDFLMKSGERAPIRKNGLLDVKMSYARFRARGSFGMEGE